MLSSLNKLTSSPKVAVPMALLALSSLPFALKPEDETTIESMPDLYEGCNRDQMVQLDASRGWIQSEISRVEERVLKECNDGEADCPVDIESTFNKIRELVYRTKMICPEFDAGFIAVDDKKGDFWLQDLFLGRTIEFSEQDPTGGGSFEIYPYAFSLGACNVVGTSFHELCHVASGVPHDLEGDLSRDWIYRTGNIAKEECRQRYAY